MALTNIQKQVRMVFDLNKCLGCQTCTSACKTQWTDRNQGQQYMYWNNVETQPGRGYPKYYDMMGGGWDVKNPTYASGLTEPLSALRFNSPLPKVNESYGAPWEYNYDQVLKTSGGTPTKTQVVPSPDPSGANAYGMNWDEDVATGNYPNAYYFYLPRICNHCTTPACLAACPRKAIYKRQEDGIVLVDQNRCRGFRYCVKGCPYKKTYFNHLENKSQKCIFCYPRRTDSLEATDPQPQLAPTFQSNFCFTQCVGRIRFVGFSGNPAANVNKLIDTWRVALRLHPEWGTEPNLYYIPPLSPPGGGTSTEALGTQNRIPVDVLASMFGDDHLQTHAQRVARIEEIFATLASERAKVAAGGGSELIAILTAHSEADRLQLHLG
ncbi:4Fe-4S dicluster domain-containing protein [Geobacter pickeringii]|uniref:4Fe-4S ferredoxin-type domain-containing protein n=1 Tax=Geobacter pickeringii TaxID=345632 RepID=A0A0B5B882_9BACT|nr:4Fe-4S dicluster domain-containing protein [Geobacter pickeringii]AJE02762.1 hypothetical protein GPICK_04705 [Geobacter pickeringii]